MGQKRSRAETEPQVPSLAVENSRSHCSQKPTRSEWLWLCRARDHSNFHCLGGPGVGHSQEPRAKLPSSKGCGGYFPFKDGQGLLKSLRNSPEAAIGESKNLLMSYVRVDSGPYSWHPTGCGRASSYRAILTRASVHRQTQL